MRRTGWYLPSSKPSLPLAVEIDVRLVVAIGQTSEVARALAHREAVASARTLTKSTHGTALTEDLPFLTPGTAINQGVVFIFATSPFVFCSVMVLDASTAGTQGVALHIVGFGAVSGTQE